MFRIYLLIAVAIVLCLASSVRAEVKPHLAQQAALVEPSALDAKDRAAMASRSADTLRKGPTTLLAKRSIATVIALFDDLPKEKQDAALALIKEAVGEDPGADADARRRWIAEKIEKDPSFRPLPIYTSKPDLPRTLPPGEELLIYAEKITDAGDGNRESGGDTLFSCPAMGFVIKTEGKTSWRMPERSALVIKAERIFVEPIAGGPMHDFSASGEFAIRVKRAMTPTIIDREKFLAAEQSCDDKVLMDIDPLVVLQYVYGEARRGNLLPMARIGVASPNTAKRGGEAKMREDARRRLGDKAPADFDKLSFEQVFTLMLQQQPEQGVAYFNLSIQNQFAPERVRWSLDRPAGSSHGTLVHNGERWLFE